MKKREMMKKMNTVLREKSRETIHVAVSLASPTHCDVNLSLDIEKIISIKAEVEMVLIESRRIAEYNKFFSIYNELELLHHNLQNLLTSARKRYKEYIVNQVYLGEEE